VGLTYKRGTTITYYHSFVTIDNKEPTAVTDAKITIRHVDSSNTLVTDINEAILTLVAENTYYYKWNIPAEADLGEYTIEAQATVDGNYKEHNENVQVVD